ncbi:MAG: tetratricopeptide repeat protein, partial [Thermodesulfovibrionales bacterium]
AKAHYSLGVAYGKLRKYSEAIEAFKRAISIDPDYAEAHNNLGVTYLKSGMYKGAVEAFEQAIMIKPDYAEAHNNLGVAHFVIAGKENCLNSTGTDWRLDYFIPYPNSTPFYD